jgi:hypothetical protein
MVGSSRSKPASIRSVCDDVAEPAEESNQHERTIVEVFPEVPNTVNPVGPAAVNGRKALVASSNQDSFGPGGGAGRLRSILYESRTWTMHTWHI